MRSFLETGLKFDWKITTITVVSTLLLLVDSNMKITSNWIDGIWWKYADRTLLYLVIPLMIVIFIFRQNPRDYGFTLGDWRAGLMITGGSILLLGLVLFFLVRGDGALKEYYQTGINGLPWNTFVDLFGWEFLFRGWILFGYIGKFGPDALWLQAVPFALAHIGKPAVETFTTIFGGFLFGWVAYRTKSFLYPFLIHWFIASFVIVVAVGLVP